MASPVVLLATIAAAMLLPRMAAADDLIYAQARTERSRPSAREMSRGQGTTVRLADVRGNSFKPQARRALFELAEAINQSTSFQAKVDRQVHLGSEKLHQYPFIYIGVERRFEPSPREVENFGRYLRRGGFAFLESLESGSESSAGEAALRHLVSKAMGSQGRFRILRNNHPVYHSFFDLNDGPPSAFSEAQAAVRSAAGPDQGARGRNQAATRHLEGLIYQGRLVAVLSDKAYGKAWELESRNQPHLQMGVNMVVYALEH